jgi:hypothetical protein
MGRVAVRARECVRDHLLPEFSQAARSALGHRGYNARVNTLGGFKLRQRRAVSGRARDPELPLGLVKYLETAEASLAEPFRGITTDGHVPAGLYPLGATGVPTRALGDAARAWLDSLTHEQRARALFPVDGDAWRRWSNIHPFLMRHGVSLDEMTERQRGLALALLRESLSAEGFQTARDVMRLNELVRVLTGSNQEYGEWLYWLSLMGEPSAHEPWGWQLDGHHLIVNAFVLGDQLVMTPMFMGSEPVAAEDGTRVFAAEEGRGLALMRALTPEQRAKATLGAALPTELFSAAFRDNLLLRYEGLPWGELSTPQQDLLLDLLRVYVGRIRAGHAEVRMDEVKRHLAETHFAWMGRSDEDSAFYCRIHSPVVLVEFDHQRGIALDNDEPARTHIHTVVRTPNGNDYGRDLLRQHHEQFDHARAAHRHG